MAAKNNNQAIVDEIHALMEGSLITAYLEGKGYTLADLKTLPETTVKQLKKEASTYASSKLAEVELRANLMQKLHDAYFNE
jgi:hypothetical protein